MGPLNCQTGSQMPDRRFCCVVWCLWLWHIDDGTGHAPDHHNASRLIPLHQMLGHSSCEQISTVHVHAPEFLHPVVRVGYGIKVLGETCRSDQVIDLAMLLNDLRQGAADRRRTGDVAVVRCNLGGSSELAITVISFQMRRRVFPSEVSHQFCRLVCSLLLYKEISNDLIRTTT